MGPPSTHLCMCGRTHQHTYHHNYGLNRSIDRHLTPDPLSYFNHDSYPTEYTGVAAIFGIYMIIEKLQFAPDPGALVLAYP